MKYLVDRASYIAWNTAVPIRTYWTRDCKHWKVQHVRPAVFVDLNRKDNIYNIKTTTSNNTSQEFMQKSDRKTRYTIYTRIKFENNLKKSMYFIQFLRQNATKSKIECIIKQVKISSVQRYFNNTRDHLKNDKNVVKFRKK